MGKIGHIIKVSVFALSIAIFGLAPVAQAKSERGNHSYNNHNSKHTYGRQSNRQSHNYSRHNNHSYGYSSYGYGGRYSYGGSYYSGHGGHGGEVALGILTGGLLFYALTANQRNTRTVYVQQQPVYAQPVQQQQVAQPQNLDSSCLQVREYQTTITVGNQTVPAYGQSCLQADGSWKLGPAIPEPDYYN